MLGLIFFGLFVFAVADMFFPFIVLSIHQLRGNIYSIEMGIPSEIE